MPRVRRSPGRPAGPARTEPLGAPVGAGRPRRRAPCRPAPAAAGPGADPAGPGPAAAAHRGALPGRPATTRPGRALRRVRRTSGSPIRAPALHPAARARRPARRRPDRRPGRRGGRRARRGRRRRRERRGSGRGHSLGRPRAAAEASTSSGCSTRPSRRSSRSRARSTAGSGFVLSADGLIVTNDHVIAGATELDVVFVDGSTAKAELVGLLPRRGRGDDPGAGPRRPRAGAARVVRRARGRRRRRRHRQRPRPRGRAERHPRHRLGQGPQHRDRGRAPRAPDPDRRGHQPGQLGRSAGQRAGRGRRASTRPTSPGRRTSGSRWRSTR